MKTKTPDLQSQTAGRYECIWCEATFNRKMEGDSLKCPGCGNSNAKDLIPIYVEEDSPEESMMYTDKDFQGGD
jgi:ribosomal protein L37AE/L43A